MTTSATSRKAALIRGLAMLQGKPLPQLCRDIGVHRSVFYRVLRGERSSAKVDRAIAKELGITIQTLRNMGKSTREETGA
jgi:hypothetical protein